ncbi:uncharacterized protein LOC112184169 [Rosa chinensis]|uniref:uncharacterized protein LOC112184169 n=1 Tax=Rosa chinensis TaxID=74649 RepID=UPI000D092B62|nr:uncharacterized protein LOC112184169 [Rosa chinensis]
MDEFKRALGDCALTTMHAQGPYFTWRGIRHEVEVKVRLDRFVTSNSWRDLFPKSRVIYLSPNESDHPPILLEVRNVRKRRRKRRKRFRFEEFWLREENWRRVVELGWDSATGDISYAKIANKITNKRDALLSWSHARFGSLKRDIEDIRKQLGQFFARAPSAPLCQSWLTLESKLHELLQKE